MTTTYSADAIAFDAAVPVISGAQKFVIPVPALADAEPLVYPAGEKAGQPIVDWQGKPIGDTGVVFYNGKDNSYQAAPATGDAVIIINQVTQAQANKIAAKLNAVGKPLTLGGLKGVLSYVRDDLGIGDMYNSDTKFIAAKMTPAGVVNGDGVGLFKRDDRDLCQAVRLSGAGEFQGPAATPQRFDNGAVVVKQGDSVRLVQSDVFLETYKHADGRPLALKDIPAVPAPGLAADGPSRFAERVEHKREEQPDAPGQDAPGLRR